MYNIHKKVACKNCGRLIDVACIKRHENACINGYKNDKINSYHLDHDDLYCKFCKKECKNKNSLAQHELRCKYNPNRKDVDKFAIYIKNNRKGKTKENCKEIAKQVQTMKNKYENGYKRNTTWSYLDKNFYHIFEDHNKEEIKKWFDYIETLNIKIPYYETNNNKEYIIIKKRNLKEICDFPSYFEHNYIANKLLSGKLKKENTVHHIDENKHNNKFNNLIVFQTSSDHKRFHTSKYAFLIYNEKTHLFKCINKKE